MRTFHRSVWHFGRSGRLAKVQTGGGTDSRRYRIENGDEDYQGESDDYVSGTLAYSDYERKRIATEGLA